MISSKDTKKSIHRFCVPGALLGIAVLAGHGLAAQQSLGLSSPQAVGPSAQSFQGSIATGEATGQVLELSLDDAIQRGLKSNLGVILSGTETQSARGQKLSDLQALLPTVDASGKETLMQSDLAAQG